MGALPLSSNSLRDGCRQVPDASAKSESGGESCHQRDTGFSVDQVVYDVRRRWKRNDDADILPAMNTPRRDDLLGTLVSLWSAMLGGAVGAIAGQLGGLLVCQVMIGFAGGLISSVILFLPLIAIARAIEIYILRRESDGEPVGGLAGDQLAGLLGGVAGAAGAVVVVALPGDADLFDARVSIVCWTVVALVAISLGLAVVRYGHWKGHP